MSRLKCHFHIQQINTYSLSYRSCFKVLILHYFESPSLSWFMVIRFEGRGGDGLPITGVFYFIDGKALLYLAFSETFKMKFHVLFENRIQRRDTLWLRSDQTTVKFHIPFCLHESGYFRTFGRSRKHMYISLKRLQKTVKQLFISNIIILRLV